MRILIVDDDYISRSQLKALLAPYGDCDSAPCGRIGLDLFEAALKEEAPYEFITLDIDMPEMSGHDVITRIREHERLEHTAEAKILMISGLKDHGNVVSSFREGCEGYLIKPVTPAGITDSLAKFHIL
jgi:two-component system, chemotaxis family, chemotaxis protein CheY